MAASLFFYDLETSGFDPKTARIMQFAGQRTDMDLQPIGDPVNVLIRLTPDVLPDPDAILVTGITPQQTLQDGVSEAEFLKLFYEEVCLEGTTCLGFNSIRFDDEFMRYLHYRNFYDAYEWQWNNSCSKWDLLDVVRMTRALRPDGIEWPFASDGKPTNRLELLTTLNKLEHAHAHDALSDVHATIAVARLIRQHQPDLFRYLYEHRGKDKVKQLVNKGEPFVYTSGRYGSDHLSTTAAVLLAPHPGQDAALVYDLRVDPADFIDKTPEQLVEHWRFSRDPDHVRLLVKTLKYNRCPAVAPLGVLNDEAQERLQLPIETVQQHLKVLRAHQADFADKIVQAVKLMDAERVREQSELIADEIAVDGRLYAGFFDQNAKNELRLVRAATPEELSSLELHDERLRHLLPLYKARNYPATLTGEERQIWDGFCSRRLLGGGTSSRVATFGKRLQALSEQDGLSEEKRYILEELQLYAQSILPLDEVAADAEPAVDLQ